MNVSRLQRLINILDSTIGDDDIQIDMRIWRIHHESGRTICCALGLAAIDLEFNKEGLRFDSRDEEPCFKGFREYEAAEKFFDISAAESLWIFAPHSYLERDWRDPSAIINHIRSVLDGRGGDLYKQLVESRMKGE